mmetsp:Transcript_35314/g.59952  ORF Transcript_35314/g.59952 Transcript_35314/m.59952 type:complete len:219 (-) Transcript_35314:131-787(-)
MVSDMQVDSVQTFRVRFSDTSEMVLVTDLSEGPYKRNLWYTQNEFDCFKMDHASYKSMLRLHIAKRSAPTASAILGMEKFLTPQLTNEYRLRRENLSTEVLKMSQWQRVAARGIPSDELIDMLAKVAEKNSRWARERARAAALFLEQDQKDELNRSFQKQSISSSQARAIPDCPQWGQQASGRETKRPRMNLSSVPSSTENGARPISVRSVTPPQCPY